MARRTQLFTLPAATLAIAVSGVFGLQDIRAGQSAQSDATAPEAAPGIPLPEKGSVWILDSASDKPGLSRIYVNSGVPNLHRGKNFLRGSLFLDAIETVDLPSASAEIRIASHSPIIFVRTSTDQREEADSLAAGHTNVIQSHFLLLRMHVAGNARVLCGFKAPQIAGGVTLEEDEVDTLTEEIAGGFWQKITSKQPLPDGEYAIALMPDDKKNANTEAYDFGIGLQVKPVPAKKP
jgi:hypothetical protein